MKAAKEYCFTKAISLALNLELKKERRVFYSLSKYQLELLYFIIRGGSKNNLSYPTELKKLFYIYDIVRILRNSIILTWSEFVNPIMI